VLITDAGMLQRVMSNLIDNALKAAKSMVSVSITLQDENWHFVVKDDGVGIADSDLKRVFDSYVSLQDTRLEETGGYGLGLYVVREFSKALGGDVDVRSVEHQGSEFTLRLPGKAISANHEQVVFNVDEVGALTGIKILVVDDDVMVLDAMNTVLNAWQCDTRVAKSQHDALTVLNDFTPDVLLLDYHLQGTTGLVLRAKMNDYGLQNAATIVITGATEQTTIDQILNAGYTVLEKPVNPDGLLAAILKESSTNKESSTALPVVKSLQLPVVKSLQQVKIKPALF